MGFDVVEIHWKKRRQILASKFKIYFMVRYNNKEDRDRIRTYSHDKHVYFIYYGTINTYKINFGKEKIRIVLIFFLF